jgi:hypothetical protein
MTKTVFLRWAAFLFLGFIGWVILAADGERIPGWIRALMGFPHGDLVGHLVLYGILACLMALAFPRRLTLGTVRPAFTSLWVAGLATAEELSQFAFPKRTPSWLDLACGLLGIALADWLSRRVRT